MINDQQTIVRALQFFPERSEIAANIAKMENLLGEAREGLLVIPELASTGYFFTRRQDLLAIVETIDRDPMAEFVRRTASDRRMAVVAGMVERTSHDRLYNAALVALPDGSEYVYRKSHLFYKETLVFEPGDSGFKVVEWDGVRIGTMICYDWRFPESARVLALGGADIIAHPSNLVASASLWGAVMATRAFENKIVAVTANRWGVEDVDGERLEFSGESRVVAMNGRTIVIAPAEGDLLLETQVDHLATRRKSFNPINDIFGDRRPELYGAVIPPGNA